MLLLTSTSSILELVTGAASTINVHVDYADNNAGTVTPGAPANQSITSATTTTICGSPASSQQRSIREIHISNVDTSNACFCTVEHYDGTTTITLMSCSLLIGEKLIFNGDTWLHYDQYGGIYQATTQAKILYNFSTGSQGAGFASDTYLTGSNILLPTSRPIAGTRYLLSFEVEKTAAGTATPIFTLRYGTNASTSDTGICTHTFAVGTAAADKAYVTVDGYFRTIGSGTSAVFVNTVSLDTNLTTTGFSNAVKNVNVVSSGFDSTTVNTYLGLSVNGGTSAAWTVNQVLARLENF